MKGEQLDLLKAIEEIEHYIEPCAECRIGRCNMCPGATVDHVVDQPTPCPCKAAGHPEEEDVT